MTTYYLPFTPDIKLGQVFGDNPGWGPNPPGGHNGDDWLTPVGTPVHSPGWGTVVFAGEFDTTYQDNWGWNLNYGGKMVVLNMDGPDGPYFEFGHNSELKVVTGQRVAPYQVIALSGATDGGTHVITGPHSHVGCLPPNFNLGTNTYGRVNPRLYMTEYFSGEISLAPEGTVSTPVTQEDDLAEADVKAITASIDFAFQRLMNELPAAVLKAPADYADPETGKSLGKLTSFETMVANQDFQHSATRRLVVDLVSNGTRAIVDAVKSAPSADAAQVAEDAYAAFLKKLDGLELNMSVGKKDVG